MKLLKFYADWCAPCKVVTKHMETIELPFEVEEINIDDNAVLVNQYKVRGIPTVVLLDDNNEEVKRLTDVVSIKQFLTEQSK